MDNTDAVHIDMNKQQSAIKVQRDLLASIVSLGSLLMVSGGGLKLTKCVYYLVS